MFKNFLLAFIAFMFFSTANAQGKIGYVSADEVFALMPEVAKADTMLAVYQQQLANTYQQQENDLNEAYAKFVKDSATLSPAVKEAKRRDLQDRISGLQGKQQQLNDALEAEKQRVIAPIRQKLMKTIQDVAKANGYAHVFYKEQVLIFPPANDITPLVKKKLGIK